ncbi:MAG: class I SAM-dependent methyltransferase [Thermoplasmata archaeon]|nr:class I SAM-dependent methyltransferase [Thermoplasmata archaeon]
MPEFDLVAPVYDTTRHAPSEGEVGAVAEMLGGGGALLEAGVGTGRYAIPLGAHGFSVTGIDLSLPMMEKARAKGLRRLARADLHRLPFRDESFDAALAVHVLQLIPDPIRGLRELARVTRHRVVALQPEGPGSGSSRGFRSRYRELAAARGYPLPPRYWNALNEAVQRVPPLEIREVARPPREPNSDPDRAGRDSRSFGGAICVPEELHAEIVAQVRQEMPADDHPGSRPGRSYRIVRWDPAQLRSLSE